MATSPNNIKFGKLYYSVCRSIVCVHASRQVAAGKYDLYLSRILKMLQLKQLKLNKLNIMRTRLSIYLNYLLIPTDIESGVKSGMREKNKFLYLTLYVFFKINVFF